MKLKSEGGLSRRSEVQDYTLFQWFFKNFTVEIRESQNGACPPPAPKTLENVTFGAMLQKLRLAEKSPEGARAAVGGGGAGHSWHRVRSTF